MNRTERAAAAATNAARALGLRVDEPRVLYDVFSVIVHVAPAPVVVRVPTVLPPSRVGHPELQAEQQRRELAVTSWLAPAPPRCTPTSSTRTTWTTC